jgi:hypothetical protein
LKRWGWLLPFLLVGMASPAMARAVSEHDVQAAAARLGEARAQAGEAGAALISARAEEDNLKAELEGILDQLASGEVRLAEARALALSRARSLYVSAGFGRETSASAGNGAPDASVRFAYAAAVSDRDRDVVNGLVAAGDDLRRLQSYLRERASDQEELARRLADIEARAGEALLAAESEYADLKAAWELQEAERIRRELEARQAATSTTTLAHSTTTTLAGTGTTTTTHADTGTTTTTHATAPTAPEPPPVSGGPFPPKVERWRPLVAAHFPADLVDQALSVMDCESFGDPSITNSHSGAAGLYQHMPRYWPSRSAAAGFPGASIYDGEANIAAGAWLVDRSMDAGLDPWFHWTCKP